MTTFNDYYHNLATTKNVTRGHVLLRCLIKAIRAKNEDKVGLAQVFIDRAFRAPTKPSKLANGGLSFWGYHHARYELRMRLKGSWPFEHTEYDVTMLEQLLSAIKAPK